MVEIYIDKEKCNGCGDCVKACPPEILFLNSTHCKVKNDLLLECMSCQSCVVVCPLGAIIVRD